MDFFICTIFQRMSGARDDESVVVELQGGKNPSQGRLTQLEGARSKAVISRRFKQKQRLENKLAELRSLISDDMTQEQLVRVATKLLDQEEALRKKQNEQTTIMNSNMEALLEEITNVRKLIERAFYSTRPPSHVGTSSTRPQDRYAASSVGSVATLHTADSRRYSPTRTRR